MPKEADKMGLFDKAVTIVTDKVNLEEYASQAEKYFYLALDKDADELQKDLPEGVLLEDLVLRDKKVSILLEYYAGSTPSLEVSFHIYVEDDDTMELPVGYYTVIFDNNGEVEDEVLVVY